MKVPAIRDRVVQGAAHLILEPIFEADFQEGSYGYRPNRSAHQALERVRVASIKGLRKVIDLDLRSYFDTVRQDRLLSKIAKRVRDKDLLWLCNGIFKSGGKRGLPQGSVIGPLWANVLLNDVDTMLEHAQIAKNEISMRRCGIHASLTTWWSWFNLIPVPRIGWRRWRNG